MYECLALVWHVSRLCNIAQVDTRYLEHLPFKFRWNKYSFPICSGVRVPKIPSSPFLHITKNNIKLLASPFLDPLFSDPFKPRDYLYNELNIIQSRILFLTAQIKGAPETSLQEKDFINAEF